MRILKFNESVGVFGVENLLPKVLEIDTIHGDFTYQLLNSHNDATSVRAEYIKAETANDPKTLVIDEPQKLTIELKFHNDEKGQKVNGSIQFGGSAKYEFIVEKPNIVQVINYNGPNSQFDPVPHFGFKEPSVQEFIRLFSKLGYQLTAKHFQFLDRYVRSYQQYQNRSESNVIMTPIFGGKILLINLSEPNTDNYMANLENFLVKRGIEFVSSSSKTEVDALLQKENIIGVIEAGSDFMISSPRSETEEDLAHKLYRELKIPIIGICYGHQSMAHFYGAEVVDSGTHIFGNFKVTDWDRDCMLFKGLDMDNWQVSTDFHDIVKNCPQGFKVIASYEDKILGIENANLLRWGLAFHPEDLEPTNPILDRFIEICKNVAGKNNSKDGVQTFNQFNLANPIH